MSSPYTRPGSSGRNTQQYAEAIDNNVERAFVSIYGRTPAEITAGVTPVDFRWPEPYPLRYGTNTTPGTTDMLAALQAAFKVGAATGKEVVIDQAYFVDIDDENDPLVMESGLTVRFTEEGSIKWDFFGLPCMYANEEDGITLISPHIICAYTIATSLPAATENFKDNVLQRTGFPDRDIMGSILFCGCDNITVVDPQFTNETVSLTTVHSRCIVFIDHSDNTPGFNNHIAGRMFIEAAHMGVLAWGQDHFAIDYIHQWQYGQLDPSTYTWEVACHVFYISALQPNSNVTIGKGYDEGVKIAGTAVNGANSWKFRRVDGFSIGDLTSYRDQGCLDFTAKHGSIGRIYWKGTSPAALAASETFRFVSSDPGNEESKENEDIHFGTVVLHFPDLNDQIIHGTSTATAPADFIYRLTIDNLIIITDGSNPGNSGNPMVGLGCSESVIRSTWIIPNLTNTTPTLFRIDRGGSKNRIEATIVDGSFAGARMVELDKDTSENNSFKVIDGKTGDVRNINNQTAFEIRTASETLSAVSGASVTAADLIPAGALLIGLTTIVTSALGTSNGTTGYTVGDGSDADRWGVLNSTAKNARTENDNWTAGGNDHFTSSQDVVITPVGGNFDGTGAIKVAATYMIGKVETDLAGAT